MQKSSYVNLDELLSNITLQLKLHPKAQPTSPHQHALQEVLAPSDHATFNTFLFPSLNHIYTKNGEKQTIQKLLQSNEKERRIRALSNEFGRLP